MEIIINISLPEDFNTLCCIYQIKPEFFIQTFINQISFPDFYSRPNDKNRWATLFFLQFLDLEESHYEVNEELEEQYLRLFNQTMKCHFFDDDANNSNSLKVGRNIMRQWMKAVLAERSNYLTNNL